MKINKNILLALTIIGGAFAYSSANATIIELVNNGEFEDPDFNGSWTHVSNTIVPGWSNSSGRIELWNQGQIGSPALGTDGLGTGQHHEVAYNSATNFTTQDLQISSDGLIDFSFDAWKRRSTGISYSLTGSISGILASNNYLFTTNNWELIEHLDLSVSSGETLSLSFQSINGGGSGAHIDQVSLSYEAVPEPSILALFGAGILGCNGQVFL